MATYLDHFAKAGAEVALVSETAVLVGLAPVPEPPVGTAAAADVFRR
jgi:hypothetical protein